MATISNIQSRIKSLNIKDISVDAIEQTSNVIIEKQQDQLRHGLNRSGKLIGDTHPYQSADYAFYKANKNSIPGLGNPDLIDTGDFVRGIKIDVTPESYTTDSTDSKSHDLQSKYGEDILGLDEENKSAYVTEALEPVFINKVREKLQL